VIFASQSKEILPHTIELSVFSKKDTIALVNNLLENKNNIEFIVEAFSNYPILIVQGSQLLNQAKGLGKEEYIKKIEQSADKIRLNIELAIKELKPSSSQLLSKIALINNQAFSKDFLSYITDYPSHLDEDIFQLSKFALVSNTDSSEDNPIFEMHDVIAEKVVEISGHEKNKKYLEDIIIKFMNAIPKDVMKGRIFRNAKTISENLEIILENAQKYNINIYKVMELSFHTINSYLNNFDYYNAEKMVNWFKINDQEGNFKLFLMNNNEKRVYAGYLGMIAGYYKGRCADYHSTAQYYTRSREVLDKVKGYESYKYNIFYNLASTYSVLGRLQETTENIRIIEQMFDKHLVDKSDVFYLHIAKTKLFLVQGNYIEALQQVNKAIETLIKNGLHPDNLLFTNSYVLKTEILNFLERYQNASAQAERLYNMHKAKKKEDHEIFGRIFTQMARSELGLGKIDEAFVHIRKAVSIFLADEKRNPKTNDVSEDPDLAASYIVQGDVLSAKSDLKQALESYRAAQKIYFYLYKNNSGNVVQVSELYLKGAKTACKLKDLYHYKAFGLPQVKEFGKGHFNTIAMFEYCKQHDMDLWAKQN